MMLENELTHSPQWTRATLDKTVAGLPLSLRREEAGLVETVRQTNMADFAKLGRIYDLSDRLHRMLQERMPAEMSCAGCCHADVAVCDIEIQYIQSVFAVERRLYLISSYGHNAGRPCIFLKNGGCSIHEARPFVCRHRLSPVEKTRPCAGACRHRSEKAIFADLEKSFYLLRKQTCSFDVFDIRDVFVEP